MDTIFEQNTRPSHDTEIERLSRLAEIEYERERKIAAERLGVRTAALDKLIKGRRNANSASDGMQGRNVQYPEPEPWPEPVYGDDLLSTVSTTIGQFVVADSRALDAAALWVLMTYLHQRLEVAPFLNITSATMRCGKSTMLETIGEMVYRPQPVSGHVSSAAISRLVEMFEPTLLMDELDTFLKNDPVMIGMLNGSQRKASAVQLKCVGDDHMPRSFSTWCPKALVGIGGLPATTTDRSIVVRLERRMAGQSHTNFRDRDRTRMDRLRQQARRWANDHGDDILAVCRSLTFPPGLDDRAQDSWEALLSIAAVAGNEWRERGQAACSYLCAERVDSESSRELILADIRDVFELAGWPHALATDSILFALNAREDRPWTEWSKGKPLTPHGLAKLLKPFKVSPGTVRFDGFTPKGYRLETLKPVFTRYLGGDSSATSAQTAENREKQENNPYTSNLDVADANLLKPEESTTCGGVSVFSPSVLSEAEEFRL